MQIFKPYNKHLIKLSFAIIIFSLVLSSNMFSQDIKLNKNKQDNDKSILNKKFPVTLKKENGPLSQTPSQWR